MQSVAPGPLLAVHTNKGVRPSASCQHTNDTLTKHGSVVPSRIYWGHLSIDQTSVDVGTACEQKPKD